MVVSSGRTCLDGSLIASSTTSCFRSGPRLAALAVVRPVLAVTRELLYGRARARRGGPGRMRAGLGPYGRARARAYVRETGQTLESILDGLAGR